MWISKWNIWKKWRIGRIELPDHPLLILFLLLGSTQEQTISPTYRGSVRMPAGSVHPSQPRLSRRGPGRRCQRPRGSHPGVRWWWWCGRLWWRGGDDVVIVDDDDDDDGVYDDDDDDDDDCANDDNNDDDSSIRNLLGEERSATHVILMFWRRHFAPAISYGDSCGQPEATGDPLEVRNEETISGLAEKIKQDNQHRRLGWGRGKE